MSTAHFTAWRSLGLLLHDVDPLIGSSIFDTWWTGLVNLGVLEEEGEQMDVLTECVTALKVILEYFGAKGQLSEKIMEKLREINEHGSKASMLESLQRVVSILNTGATLDQHSGYIEWINDTLDSVDLSVIHVDQLVRLAARVRFLQGTERPLSRYMNSIVSHIGDSPTGTSDYAFTATVE